ncbi:MAG: heterodisulfide reductase-related iron-sulfur binding cluster [Planctomycetota bacterium]|nr:heterodisulfide reductase-related iron-sulfur binding cluster [Planctomycetota bacterium]
MDPRDPQQLVDYVGSLDCIHCGLCLNTCPTYRLTGVESSSPRGRIHMMRALAEGAIEADADYADELDFCLLCRNCETVCPSGVQFGHLMEHARGALEPRRDRTAFQRLGRRVGFDLLLRDRGALRFVAVVGRAAQRAGLVGLAARIAGPAGHGLRDAPSIPPASERTRLPVFTPALGARRGAVALLEGCVMPELLGATNRATVRVLAACGFDVHVSRQHVCCGSLHAHNGEPAGARALAVETIAAFDALVDEAGAPLPLVVNSAGCGSHLKELAHAVPGEPDHERRAQALSRRTLDLCEFLARGAGAEGLAALIANVRARDTVRVTWDDPCHLLHGQRIRREPRDILRRVPGVELVEMEAAESCCGSAGIYSLLRPDDATRILDPKLEALRATGASVLVTANPGCQLQWAAGIRRAGVGVRVLHVAEVIDEFVLSAASRPGA